MKQPAAQQQLGDPMPACHQITTQILARTNEIAQRLKLTRRDHQGP